MVKEILTGLERRVDDLSDINSVRKKKAELKNTN